MTEARRAVANSTFSKGGVSCSADNVAVAESSLLRIDISAEKLAQRKARQPLGVIYHNQKQQNNANN